jgi:hypothetical protein
MESETSNSNLAGHVLFGWMVMGMSSTVHWGPLLITSIKLSACYLLSS